MSTNRWIFYGVFAAFHVGAFIFSLILQDVDLNFLMKTYSYIGWFKWITLLGIILLVTDIVWSFIAKRDLRKENSALIHENNTLKAKLFDIQEASAAANAAKAGNTAKG